MEGNENINFCNTDFICKQLINNPDSISINFNGSNCLNNEQVKNQCLNHTAEDFSNFKIYPNPTNGILTISGLQGEAHCTLFDVSGKLIFKNSSLESINISEIPRGIYLLEVNSNNKILRHKVVKLD